MNFKLDFILRYEIVCFFKIRTIFKTFRKEKKNIKISISRVVYQKITDRSVTFICINNCLLLTNFFAKIVQLFINPKKRF